MRYEPSTETTPYYDRDWVERIQAIKLVARL